MDDIYKISSTERVQRVEKELATQLTELKTEIEGNGGLRETVYCSVPFPKDVEYFRRERELALKKCLQVAEAKTLVIQADDIQRELESCLKREYTSETLPLLLHQFFADRITQLVQSKYLHMLRWKRFCQHSSVAEQFYSLYQKQVAHIMQEYDDAVQRAVRLSRARENFLTGEKNPANVVTQEDLEIYTQWLICHLHSLKTIHNYLRVLQYLPISHRMEVGIDRAPTWNEGETFRTLPKTEFLSPSIHFPICPGPSTANGMLLKDVRSLLPQHSPDIDGLKPQLKLLLSQLGINYAVEDLRHSADEMELFSMVTRQFRKIFSEQQTMRTFPVYDAGMPGSEAWGTVGPHMTLKKRANWISYIKIKAKQDPWQQKLLMKLGLSKKADELLLLQAKFLEVSNMEWVMQALQEQATAVLQQKPLTSASMTSFNSQQYDQIWEKIYCSPEFYQAKQTYGNDENPAKATDNRGTEDGKLNEGHTFSRKKKEASDTVALQLLGLDEDTETHSQDLGPRKGAYLSLLYLRHLRIRQLQRICLGILNYFRSIERSLTISTSGLILNLGHLVSTAEDSCWVNAAKGGTGDVSGLGAHSYMHYTPADYKVHSVKFMEFAEIDNHDDFYITEEVYIHTQDQRGVFVMYDVALEDLKKLEKELLLVATQYIDAEKGHKVNSDCNSSFSGWAHTAVDRAAVLLDLWTCEAAFLENKWQLLDSYFEAYQHALDSEERFTLAQVITDIMYRRPRFDFRLGYFLDIYKDECACLRLHTQLARDIINQQIDKQRDYNHKIWHDGPKGGISEFGFPPYIVSKQLIALTKKNIYLLEFHPSLGLMSLISKGLGHVLQEFLQICRPKIASEAIKLETQVLQLALDTWLTMESPESFYGLQIQKDVYVLVEDPSVVREIALSALKAVAEEEQKQGKEKQALSMNVFSRILELLILRHRLIEAAAESAQLGRLYKEFAGEMGFDEFHLYLRPVYFEFATEKEKVDQRPSVFVTSLQEPHDSSVVDRYIPSSLMLNIQDIDNQIGKFSFRTRDSILQLLLKPYGMDNLQIALACQITHKNTVLVAVQQAAFCPMMPSTQTVDMKEGSLSLRSQSSSVSGKTSTGGKEAEDQLLAASWLMSYVTGRFAPGHNTLRRPPDAFISIQLETQGPRDLMLNTFIEKKQILGSRMQNPEEAEKVKRELIIDYCHRMSHRISQYSLRSQIIAYYNSIKAMLDDFPSVRAKYFIIGLPQEKKGGKEKPENDPRSFQPRPHSLLSSDGRSFLNLWFIPHPSEVLFVYRNLQEKTASRALRQTLQIVAALHDIISYIFSFVQLGNAPSCFDYQCPEHLTADWGGTEWIGYELQELQKKIDCLQNPSDPAQVAQLLTMHRELLFLQFDAAVRHSMRKMFLSSGNVGAYQSLTDNMYHGLPPLSNALVGSLFGSQLRLPQPLDPHGPRLCLCGLNDENRRVAHGELVGMQFVMEDVLWNNNEILSDHQNRQTSPREDSETIIKTSRKALNTPLELPDPVASCALQRSYLILWKQLEMLKAEWGRLKLKVEDINTVPLYKQFSELYGTEVMFPAMKSLARHKGIEDEFEGFRTTYLLPPEEASEVEIKAYQLQKLLESLEIHMIHDVQKKINKEITLVISEKAREERNLPIELWKHHSMQASFSVTRPEIAESFIQRLMEHHRETDTEIAFQKGHFEKCLMALGCGIMARERSNFETYSMFYENILRQQHQLLYQKEQEIHAIEDKGGKSELGLSQIAELCHETIVEVTALRARLADLQEEGCSLKEKIRKEMQEEYEALVQNIFMVCLQLKGKVDEYHLSMNQQTLEIISEVRKEGVNKMIDLKKKFGSRKDSNALKENLELQEQLQELRNENSQLGQLVSKLKAMSCWKEMVGRARLSARVREAEKEAIQNKKECLKSKVIAEQETILFRQQLRVARKALVQTRAENKRLKQQLDKQVRHQLAQERSLKQNAFQRIDALQCQLYDLEAAASQGSFHAARRKRFTHLSHSASSIRHSFSGIASVKQKTGTSVFTRDFREQVLTTDSLRSSSVKSEKNSRPRTVPTGLRERVTDVLLPELTEDCTLKYFPLPPSASQDGI
ncbi:hypothetical protein JRQ81_007119 [Phrynocephalus forsythii]|uniref:DUF4549 domain-containing protein n=1 Tax=Phrynocephalus forsythii TaxID=171643 RepID=A0A9Q0Y4I4_9SAUR|nr:hypothetical protein JRQ81_007119 [Phrynocephalus forsythii]